MNTINITNELVSEIKTFAASFNIEQHVFESNKKAPKAKEGKDLTIENVGDFCKFDDKLQVWEIGVFYGLKAHKSDWKWSGENVKCNAELQLTDGTNVNKTKALKSIDAYEPQTTEGKATRQKSFRTKFEEATKEVEEANKKIELLQDELAHFKPTNSQECESLIKEFEAMKMEFVKAEKVSKFSGLSVAEMEEFEAWKAAKMAEAAQAVGKGKKATAKA